MITEKQHQEWKKDLEESHSVKTENKRLKKVVFVGLDHDDLQAIKEACCEACKGDIGFWDSDCRFNCEGFIDETFEYIATDSREVKATI